MARYEIISADGTFTAQYTYAEGYLTTFSVSKPLPDTERFGKVWGNFINQEEQFVAYWTRVAPERISRMDESVSFEDFWVEYGKLTKPHYGVNPDKARAKKIWDSLKASEQVKAFNYLPKYKNMLIRSGVAPKYAKVYLHSKDWEL